MGNEGCHSDWGGSDRYVVPIDLRRDRTSLTFDAPIAGVGAISDPFTRHSPDSWRFRGQDRASDRLGQGGRLSRKQEVIEGGG
jgi:hypothetical protein